VLLALEVVWFRFLLLYLDGTTLVFAVMLAVVLAGIGLGGLAGARAARRGWLGAGAARAAAVGAVLAVVAGYAGFGKALGLLAPWRADPVPMAVGLSVFLMAPAALLSGFLFTALGALLRERANDAAGATGMLTLANTAGAMLGSLAAAFVLLPLLGMERSFFLLALAYGLLALVVPAPRRAWRPALAAALALALFPFGAMTGAYYRDVEARHGGRIVAVREGIAQTAFYLRHDFLGEPLFHRLVTNSHSMSSTAVGPQRYMTLFAWLPAALHPRIERALVLCYGVGTTAHAVTELPEVEAIDVVDTSRDVLAMSDVVFPEAAEHPLRDPRVTAHVEDARFFLLTTPRRYDLITGEPPPPKMAGVASLYSREYFELVRSRLAPGGIATYWLPVYLVYEDEALSIVRAFCDAFEDCSLWSGLNRDWILMGSNGGLAPVPRGHFSRLWDMKRIGAELRRLGIDGPDQLAGQFMADAGALREIAADAPALVDDRPRRIRSELYAQPSTPRYAMLMDAARARERFERGPWASIVPVDGAEGFRRRAILTAALNPGLRTAGYNLWDHVAGLVRDTGLVELPRWLLGSGATAAQIAARRGPDDPVAAEHLAIDAVANRRPPPGAIEKGRFEAMTPRGQLVTVFHDCLAGDPARAWTLIGWMRAQGRANLDPAFLAWAGKECQG
jgi:spermidine synthase